MVTDIINNTTPELTQNIINIVNNTGFNYTGCFLSLFGVCVTGLGCVINKLKIGFWIEPGSKSTIDLQSRELPIDKWFYMLNNSSKLNVIGMCIFVTGVCIDYM